MSFVGSSPFSGECGTPGAPSPWLPLIPWFRANARDLPWREEGTSAWGVLVSEVMSQQTPVARVAPVWLRWMSLWPGPADLAAAPRDAVVREWGKLGYPRRALRLRDCASAIVGKHGGRVPADVGELLALPGIGEYTARAVAAFAFGRRVPVVDVNVRRVLRRHRQATFLPGTHKRADLAAVEELLPADEAGAAVLSAAAMELGATVCRTRPDCGACPLLGSCAWVAAGSPEPSEEELAAAKRRVQKFEGTDRQVRGKLLDVLRAAESPVEQAALDAVWADGAQRARALFSLLDDGLAVQDADGRFRLPR